MAELVLSIAGTIADIALQIGEAAVTVPQNEEECRKIASCVDINSRVLQLLVKETDVAKVEVMRRALEDVKASFEEALRLVEKCQRRRFLYRFFWAKDMAGDLDRVMRDVGLKMQQASLCGTAQGVIVATKIHSAVTAAAPEAPAPPSGEDDDIEDSIAGFTRFSLSALKKATNNFSRESMIGRGVFAEAYKGLLHGGLEVVIKKFDKHSDFFFEDQQRDFHRTMFRGEFEVGMKLKHKNVVKHLGYCIDIKAVLMEHDGRVFEVEDRKNFLVLGYVTNGSLQEVVTGKRHIDWSLCFMIIQETAQGVCYIHEQRVIHLDLKPSNILFNSDMTPVIIHSGLAKVLDPGDDDEMVLDGVIGTTGYIAPEHYSGRVSFKSDVFVFGITLLKTIISEDVVIKYASFESGPWYGREQWERMLEEAGGPKGLVNPAIHVGDESDKLKLMEINRCVEVGLLCTESNLADRPSMADVVDMLSGKKPLSMPKKPENMSRKKLGRHAADSRT